MTHRTSHVPCHLNHFKEGEEEFFPCMELMFHMSLVAWPGPVSHMSPVADRRDKTRGLVKEEEEE